MDNYKPIIGQEIFLRNLHKTLVDEITKLKIQNQKYREALKKYADEKEWHLEFNNFYGFNNYPGFKLAQDALKEEEDAI